MYLESAKQLVNRKGLGRGVLEILQYICRSDLSEAEKKQLTDEGFLIDGKPNADVIYSAA